MNDTLQIQSHLSSPSFYVVFCTTLSVTHMNENKLGYSLPPDEPTISRRLVRSNDGNFRIPKIQHIQGHIFMTMSAMQIAESKH